MRSNCGERRGQSSAPQQQVACPRCESSKTKFCYYNNYSLSQPRHFCKSCRRYWTHGGALRNVPVGGAPRKRSRPSPISVHPELNPKDAVSDQESLTSLLGFQEQAGFLALGGSSSGPTTTAALDEMGQYNFGGRGIWASPEVGDVAGGGGDTCQLGGVESGLVEGDCFPWPELMAGQGLQWSL